MNEHIKSAGRRGFTLIELLIVISIIGILLTILLASLQSGKESAQTASGLQCSASNYRFAGANAVGFWTFDEGGAGNAASYAASGVSFPLKPSNNGAVLNRSSATPSGRGYSLSIINNGPYGTTGAISPALNPGASLTASAWIYFPSSLPSLTGYGTVILASGPSNAYPIWIYWDGGDGRLYCRTSDYAAGGNPDALIAASFSFRPDKWYQVACSLNQTAGRVDLYIDGRQNGTAAAVFSAAAAINRVQVGYDTTPAASWTVNIDDAAIYPQALTAEDIGRLYALNAPARNLAAK